MGGLGLRAVGCGNVRRILTRPLAGAGRFPSPSASLFPPSSSPRVIPFLAPSRILFLGMLVSVP